MTLFLLTPSSNDSNCRQFLLCFVCAFSSTSSSSSPFESRCRSIVVYFICRFVVTRVRNVVISKSSYGTNCYSFILPIKPFYALSCKRNQFGSRRHLQQKNTRRMNEIKTSAHSTLED